MLILICTTTTTKYCEYFICSTSLIPCFKLWMHFLFSLFVISVGVCWISLLIFWNLNVSFKLLIMLCNYFVRYVHTSGALHLLVPSVRLVHIEFDSQFVGPLVGLIVPAGVWKCGPVADLFQHVPPQIRFLRQNLHRLLVDLFARDANALLLDLDTVAEGGAGLLHTVNVGHVAGAHTCLYIGAVKAARQSVVTLRPHHRFRHIDLRLGLVNEYFQKQFVTQLFFCQIAFFMGIAVVTFAVCGRNRDWMPRWQQNWFGWSFIIAVVTCILETILGGSSIFRFNNTNFLNFKHTLINYFRIHVIVWRHQH